MKPCEFEGYTLITAGIRVSVQPEHLEENSSPTDDIFAFSYTVRIENLTLHPVQLLERHWLIFSGGNRLAEVVGPGVVGEQPLLEVGEAFEYTSTTIIQDPIGLMKGSYTFRAEPGEYFVVEVPPFDLHYPVVMH